MSLKAWLPLIGTLLCIGATPPATQRANAAPNPPPEAPTAPAKIETPTLVSMQSPQWWSAAARAEADQITDNRTKCLRYGQIMLVYAQTGDVTQAKDCLKTYRSLFGAGIRLPNQEAQAAALLIRVLSRSGRIDEAGKLLELAEGIPSAQDRLLGAMAIGRALAGDLPAAFKAGDSIRQPLRDRMYLAMARELIDAGATEDARLVLDRLGSSVSSIELRRLLAIELARAGNVKASLGILVTFSRSPPGVKLIGRSLYSEMARAAAAANKDDAARTIVAAAPETDHQTALAELGAGQIDRGDLNAARETLNSLGQSGAAYDLRHSLALAYAHKGDYAAAERLDGDEIALELFSLRFDDLLKSHQYDAAAADLHALTDDALPLKSRLRFSLAVALISANQAVQAIDLYQNANRDPYFQQVRVLVDEAYLRSGNTARYQADRKPLVDNLAVAIDGPPKLRASRELWSFDFLTGNFKAAEAEADSAHLEADGFTYGSASMLAKRLDLGYFAYARELVRWAPRNPEPSARTIALVAAAHVRAGRAMELFEWIKKLPLATQRCDAYLAAADALIPKPAIPREF